MNDVPRTLRHPAGFWIRGVAALVDFAVFALVFRSLELIGQGVIGATAERSPFIATVMFTMLFAAVYTTTLHALGGQTLGKMLLGVRVQDASGSGVRAGAALLRFFAYFASLLSLGVGFVMAGLRSDKRALHDLIAGTRVERVVTARPPAAADAGESSPAGAA